MLNSLLSKFSKNKEKTTEDIENSFVSTISEARQAAFWYDASLSPERDEEAKSGCKKRADIHVNKSATMADAVFDAEIVNFSNIKAYKAKSKIRFYADNKDALASNSVKVEDYPNYNLTAEDIRDIQGVINISSAYKNTIHAGLSEKQISNRMAALVATSQIVGYVDDPKFQALAGGFYNVCAEQKVVKQAKERANNTSKDIAPALYKSLMNQR